MHQPILRIFFIFVLLHIFSASTIQAKVSAENTENSPNTAEKKGSPFSFFKDKDVAIFPVPVWESRPDRGNSYGLMPVMLLSDKGDDAIKAIFAVVGQYNSIFKVSGAALAYFYPNPDQEVLFYGELAQDYLKDFTFRFFDPSFFNDFYLEIDASYLNTPFGFFYGFGPDTVESDKSNYISRNILIETKGGYYFLENLRFQLGIKFHKTNLSGNAFNNVQATTTRYTNLPNVSDSTNLIYDFGFVFDNRKNREYSTTGALANASYFFSLDNFGSDQTFHGLDLELIHLFPLIKGRWTSVFRYHFQRTFGDNSPFYELPSLGGSEEFRSFVPQRFVDKGKIIFQLEERVRLFSLKVLGKKFDLYADPFFEVGRVFDQVSHLGFGHWQPVGGLGIRAFVPPNVIGRIDLAVGTDGFEIYTALGYPF